MKFSEMWIREWANPPVDSVKLIDQLTMAGFKVNELKPVSKKFYGVVIGEIVDCKMHPKVHNIWITKVNNGTNKLLNIICDSSNCRKNIRVVVANIGAILPNKHKIKLTTIYGQKSEGILCDFSILGIINNTIGIIELPENAPIGQNFYDYLHLDDNIIEINIPPNRGDCLNIIGISREVAAINHLKLKQLNTYSIKPTISDIVPIAIEVPNECPQFLGRILKNININASTPLWMTEKLRRCGIYSINVIVDIANYVLLEIGHPINIIDYEKIDGNMIYIRFSQIGETLKLSNNNIKLFPNTVIISDKKKPLLITGMTIPNQYCISSKTRDIFLQSGFFSPYTIMEQSKRYRMYYHDLAAFRYARGGVDPNISKFALDHITSLLLEICGGCPGPITSIIKHDKLPPSTNIVLHRSKLNKTIGFHILNQEITRTLTSLGFQIKFSDDNWRALVPSWRFDISIEENLIAEIVRFQGHSKIPDFLINKKLITNNFQKSTISFSRIKALLVDRGYQEIITYSFVDPNIQNLLHPQQIPLIIKNPITSEMSAMRLSLWSGLIKSTIYNQHRQQKQIKLFESGICFIPDKRAENQVRQNFMVAGIRSGLRFNTHWDCAKNPVDFYDIKGDVEALLNITNKLYNIKFKKYIHPALHAGKSAAIYLNSTCIGYIGMIHPTIQTKLNLHSHALVFELSWRFISQSTLSKITTISKFPKNYRDISVIIPDNTPADSIIIECKKIAKEDQLIEIQLSDVYKGPEILKGFKSFTIKLILQSKTHTLREEEISDIINQCSIILTKRFHGILR